MYLVSFELSDTERRRPVATRFALLGREANQVGESGEVDPIRKCDAGIHFFVIWLTPMVYEGATRVAIEACHGHFIGPSYVTRS